MPNEPQPANIDDLISDFSRFYILTILYEGPAHGYSIISQFKKRVKKEVSPSLVYPFLQQLEEKGLVTHTQKPVGEKERKSFDRTDFAGREYTVLLSAGKFFGTSMKLPVVSNLAVGDALVQAQLVSLFEFNMLLSKLDLDSVIAATDFRSSSVKPS